MYGAGAGAIFNFILALALASLLLTVSHAAWVAQVVERVRVAPFSAPAKAAVIAAAALTPLVGFYAALLLERRRSPPSERPRAGAMSVIMPAIVVAALFAMAWRLDAQYIPSDRSWENVGRSFLHLGVLYVLFHAVIYMAARVFGLTRRGPLATLANLGSIAATSTLVLL